MTFSTNPSPINTQFELPLPPEALYDIWNAPLAACHKHNTDLRWLRYLKQFCDKGFRNLNSWVRLWLVRAWVRIPFAAIFAEMRWADMNVWRSVFCVSTNKTNTFSFRQLNTNLRVQVVQSAQVKLGGKTKNLSIDQQNGAQTNFRKDSSTSVLLVTCATWAFCAPRGS